MPERAGGFVHGCDRRDVDPPLETAQDHKRVGDGDTGPNTGGMGAFSPAPGIGRALFAEVQETVLKKAVASLQKEGRPFLGVLYAGLMLTAAGPRVLEFNARFGDPETQPVLMRLESDLVDLMSAAVDGSLARSKAVWKSDPAVCVVAAAKGYPARPETGQTIEGLDEAARWPQTVVFHGGDARSLRRSDCHERRTRPGRDVPREGPCGSPATGLRGDRPNPL